MPTIRTTMEPWREIVVTDAEYLSLLRADLIWDEDGPPPPPPPSFTDAQYTELAHPEGEAVERVVAAALGEIDEGSISTAIQAAVLAEIEPEVDAAEASAAASAASAAAAEAALLAIDVSGQVATAFASSGSAVSQSAATLFPIYRIWDGASYPPRVTGAINIFFGPTDPGLAMAAGDYWANPAVTTAAAVVAAILDSASATFAAVQTVTNGNSITIPLRARSGETVPYQSVGIAGSGLYGWQLDATNDEGLSGDLRIPYGWNVARVRILFVTSAAGSGDIRFGRSAVAYRDAASVSVIAETFHTVAAAATNTVKSFLHTGDIALATYDHINVNVSRYGTSGSDTLAVPIYILGARLEKVS